jgi:hypothetical protein
VRFGEEAGDVALNLRFLSFVEGSLMSAALPSGVFREVL